MIGAGWWNASWFGWTRGKNTRCDIISLGKILGVNLVEEEEWLVGWLIRGEG